MHRSTILFIIATLIGSIGSIGCVPSQNASKSKASFKEQELDACLAFVIDQSGSFEGIWKEGGYELFLKISDRFFKESMGQETRIVIAQLSGAADVVLFEGRPSDLKRRFSSPEEMAAFLKANSDPTRSPVFEATKRVTDYLNEMPGINEKTKLLTVIISDMADSEFDLAIRQATGNRMLESLSTYQKRGGALALYCVDPAETPRWRKILTEAGFAPGQFVIENALVESPQLPSFY